MRGGAGEGATSTSRCRPGRATTATRTRSTQVVAPRRARVRARTCSSSAPGQDASATDPLGRMSITVPGFRALTDRAVALAGEVCDGRLVAMLEGGYSLHAPPARQPRDPRGARRAAGRRSRTDPIGVDVPLALRDVERAAVAAAARAHLRLMLHDAHGLLDRRGGQPGGAPAAGGRARRRRRRRRRRLHRHVDGVARAGGRARTRASSCSRAARCGHGPSGRNGGFVSSIDLGAARRCGADYGEARRTAWVDGRARDRRRDRRLVRGRGRRRLVPRAAASWCVSTAPAQDAASAPTRSTATHVLAQTRGAGAGALRLAGVPRRRVRRPRGATCIPRGSRSGCASGCCARGARIFEGSRGDRRAAGAGGDRGADGRAARVRAPHGRASPSTPPPARCRRCATGSRSPPATSSAPSRCPT